MVNQTTLPTPLPQPLCRACAGEQYYQYLESRSRPAEKDWDPIKRQAPDQGLE